MVGKKQIHQINSHQIGLDYVKKLYEDDNEQWIKENGVVWRCKHNNI